MFIMFADFCIRIDTIISVFKGKRYVQIKTKADSFSNDYKTQEEAEKDYKRITDVLLALKAD